jgi:hypothetical protein
VELSVKNYATEAETLAFMQSDAFRKNPAGIDVDPAEYVGKYRGAYRSKNYDGFQSRPDRPSATPWREARFGDSRNGSFSPIVPEHPDRTAAWDLM